MMGMTYTTYIILSTPRLSVGKKSGFIGASTNASKKTKIIIIIRRNPK